MMKRQRGMTLLVVLVMLVVITLLGIASIRISGSNLLVVGNMQSRKLVENYGLQAIEQVMNSIAPFNAPTSAVAVTVPASLAVSVSNRTCTFSAPAAGANAGFPLAPRNNKLEINVYLGDSFNGPQETMGSGVKIRQLAGACS